MSPLSRPPIAAPRQSWLSAAPNHEALQQMPTTASKPYETKNAWRGGRRHCAGRDGGALTAEPRRRKHGAFRIARWRSVARGHASNGRGNLVCGQRTGQHLAPSGRPGADRPACARHVAHHPTRNGVSVSRGGRLAARLRGDHHAALAWHGRGPAHTRPLDADRGGRLRLKATLRPGWLADSPWPPSAGLAQLVEQRFCKPWVGGSSPSTGTKSLSDDRSDVPRSPSIRWRRCFTSSPRRERDSSLPLAKLGSDRPSREPESRMPAISINWEFCSSTARERPPVLATGAMSAWSLHRRTAPPPAGDALRPRLSGHPV